MRTPITRMAATTTITTMTAGLTGPLSRCSTVSAAAESVYSRIFRANRDGRRVRHVPNDVDGPRIGQRRRQVQASISSLSEQNGREFVRNPGFALRNQRGV